MELVEKDVLKCVKCEGEMAEGTKTVLGNVFACTRRESEKTDQPSLERVQPYYCTKCGFIEFYKHTS